MPTKILITGCNGFIGFHLSRKFLSMGYTVIGIDNNNSYYDPNLKNSRYRKLCSYGNFFFKKIDIKNKEKVDSLFEEYNIDKVIHLAAQAGVRYSLENPQSYIDSNLIGFFNIIQNIKRFKLPFIYASSSSVYGNSKSLPFVETQQTDEPESLYASTKKSNELMAFSYWKNHNIPSYGLRFFTVYGPYGRPDMAYFSFTKNIIENKEIKLFNNGSNLRDFTYIDDIVNSIFFLSLKEQHNYEIFNIGNSNPISTIELVNTLQEILNKKALTVFVDKQNGDVDNTYSDSTKLFNYIGIKPNTNLRYGLTNFINWYKDPDSF